MVASEVQSLANQTAKATEDIVAQIAGMQEATGGVLESAQELSVQGETLRAEIEKFVNAAAA